MATLDTPPKLFSPVHLVLTSFIQPIAFFAPPSPQTYYFTDTTNSNSATLIMEKATEQQIQRFKSLAEANKHGPTKTSSVYVWEQDEVVPAFFQRTLILKSEGYYDWKDCGPSQRHF
ncbi:hypothetical protein CVT25_002179 [Psilocybe cyanescens]|uniref:Uncharacterized protein n=1 Tax=Psilocybe cyanescens TaxID=93625 RepID=A0A409WZY7_PSICY|nr:hypothetical protein CVT25_002179 [Psilocybe cyanescens]